MFNVNRQTKLSEFQAIREDQPRRVLSDAFLHRSVWTLKSIFSSGLSLAVIRSVQRRSAAASVDRSYAEVAVAGFVHVRLRRWIAVLLRVDWSLVGRVRIWVDIWFTSAVTLRTRRAVLVVDRWFSRLRPQVRSSGFRRVPLLWKKNSHSVSCLKQQPKHPNSSCVQVKIAHLLELNIFS